MTNAVLLADPSPRIRKYAISPTDSTASGIKDAVCMAHFFVSGGFPGTAGRVQQNQKQRRRLLKDKLAILLIFADVVSAK